MADISGERPSSSAAGTTLPSAPVTRDPEVRSVEHCDLSPAAALTREKLASALDKRFFGPRYGERYWAAVGSRGPHTPPAPDDGWLLDMCVLVTPSAQSLHLPYVSSVIAAMGGSKGETVPCFVCSHFMHSHCLLLW